MSYYRMLGGTPIGPMGQLQLQAGHLYVATTGSDLARGDAPTRPLRTLDKAIQLANLSTKRDPSTLVVIHLASGNYAQTRPLLRNIVGWGDGAGQPGDDGFEVVAGPFSSLAGSTANQIVSADLVDDEYRFLTVEVLTGAAAGSRRHVRNNTATTIVPVAPFPASVGTGASYRFVRSTVNVTWPAGNFYPVQGADYPEGVTPRVLGNGPVPYTPATAFVGMRITVNGGNKWFPQRTVFYGVDMVAGATYGIGGRVSCGCEYGGGQAPLGLLLGAAGLFSWSGWGLYGDSGSFNLTGDAAFGYMSSNRAALLTEGTFLLTGGSIAAASGDSPALAIRRGEVSVQIGNTVAPYGSAIPTLIQQTNAGLHPAIGMGRANNSAQYGGPVRLRLEAARLESAGGPALRARGDATVQFGTTTDATGGTTTISGSGTIGMDVSWGASCWTTGVPTLTGSLGDMTVDAGGTYQANATLAAAGNAHFNAADGSRIIRVM